MATPGDKYMPPLPSPAKKKKKKKAKDGDDEAKDGANAKEDEATKAVRREALAAVLRDDLKTPYLTCQRCNAVTFINVNRVRARGADPTQPLSVYEQLPVCSGCGTTKYLRAGVVSFQDKIEEEKQKIQEFEQKRVPATHLIVRIARGFLGRLAFRRRKREHELYLWRIRVSATRIQARVRGMQARRRTFYERCLRIVRTMHASILQYALQAKPDRAPVLWYDNPGELQILYCNYREFVRRSGGKPPLFKVESNILEITKRMLLREYELVSRIQSRWRGLTTRLVFFEYKRQRGWLNGVQQSPAIKIQRLYRAHHAKRRCSALRALKKYPDRMAAYREERQTQAKHEMAKAFRKKLLAKYRLTYQTDRTSKMLALHAKPEQGDDDDDHQQRHAEHSLKVGGAQWTTATRTAPLQPPASRYPNARRLAQMKKLVDAKRQPRGPRLRILTAQEFASSREEKDA